MDPTIPIFTGGFYPDGNRVCIDKIESPEQARVNLDALLAEGHVDVVEQYYVLVFKNKE